MKTLQARILELEKRLATTGPRGGEIIGKTKSGKPIYDTHDHPTHKGFTPEDHDDAVVAHRSKAKAVGGRGPLADNAKADSHIYHSTEHALKGALMPSEHKQKLERQIKAPRDNYLNGRPVRTNPRKIF